ncbi:MAG TPA: hypothetical protein VFQ36_07600 [Ktedonobacteraceae bacterium]|nr:hypothetical protein [Ktedonobacteraceae bacterium]
MFISKRILIIISIVGIIILGALGFTTFQLLNQPSASATGISSTVTPTPLATTPGSTVNRACATGIISSINAQNQTFVVTEAKGSKTLTVTADSQTTFHKRGETGVTFGSLATGQHVRVTSQTACDATTTTFTAKGITIVVPTTPTATPTGSPTP